MYSGVWYQLCLFAVFFIFGAVFALVYDTFRISERFVRSGIVAFVFKDILFWLVITVLMFAICLRFNNGEIRLFMFVAVFAGAMTYFGTLSKYVLNIMCFVINILKKIIVLMLNILFIPLRFLVRIVNKPIFLALSFSKKSMKKLCKKVKFKVKIFRKFKRLIQRNT